jgi:hypothetical protein
MVTISQVLGMLLEEALLYLLRLSGYQTVEEVGSDVTLYQGNSGLEVLGRGGKHQIDAIANYTIAHPFSHPQRLLLEAKFHNNNKNKTGIEVVRNSVGVLKDVSEYWVSRNKVPPKARYHYQYAIFSTSGYTSPAQKYAYAQDIYLIPLYKSTFFQPILNAIHEFEPYFDTQAVPKQFLTRLRSTIRNSLRHEEINLGWLCDLIPYSELSYPYRLAVKVYKSIQKFCRTCHQLNGALLAMISRQFPLFLVPNPDNNPRINDLEKRKFRYNVEIDYNEEGGYLRDSVTKKSLFSFDLPQELFKLYASQGLFSETSDFNHEADYSSGIQAIVTLDNIPRVITFQLENGWLNKMLSE